MPFDVSTLRGPQEVAAYPGELKAPFPKRQLILNAFDMLSPAHVVTGGLTLAETRLGFGD